MTYADPRLSRAYPHRNTIVKDNTAVGKDSDFINEEYKRTIEHYLIPTTTRWANPAIRFNTLKVDWEAGTAHLSSIAEIAMHPAYQQIIGMGTIAIPFILSELKKKPGHWFWALKSITGEDPVLPQQRGRMKEMTEAWLRWGKEQGYL